MGSELLRQAQLAIHEHRLARRVRRMEGRAGIIQRVLLQADLQLRRVERRDGRADCGLGVLLDADGGFVRVAETVESRSQKLMPYLLR